MMKSRWLVPLLVLVIVGGVLAFRGVLFAQVPVEFEYIYDGNQRLVRVIDSLGNVLTYTYDAAGNIISVAATTTASLGPPVIDSVTPSVVNREETVPITITGTNLLLGTLTTDNPGIGVVDALIQDTEATATFAVVADAILGPTTVTITTGLGPGSGGITVLGPLPKIIGISPPRGEAVGGTAVTLVGTNFTADSTVTFGGLAVTDLVFVDSATMTATAPAGPPGTQVDVVISNANGSTTLVDGFSYVFPLSVPGVLAIATGGTGFLPVSLDQPVAVDTEVTLASSNPAVATVPASATILTGEQTVVVPVTAVAEGTSTVTTTLGAASLTTTVFVSPPFVGDLDLLAALVGSFVTPRENGPIVASPVGAFVTPRENGPILAPPVGAFVTPRENGPIVAPPVGAFVTPRENGPIVAPPVGVFVTPADTGPILAPIVGVEVPPP